MIYLSLSILSAASLFVIFKFFDKFKVNNYQAIMFNYLVASSLGFLFSSTSPIDNFWNDGWKGFAILLGAMFISIFIFMALSTQKSGITLTSIANKMSLVIPVTIAIIAYNESVNILKVTGIILALLGIYMSSVNGEEGLIKRSLLYPLIVFFGSGAIDSIIKYVEKTHLDDNNSISFVCILFGVAAIGGILITTFRYFFKGEKLALKNLLWGIILGIPNFGSIYFLISAFKTADFESSAIISVNNIGVVIFSALFAVIIFRERLNYPNIIGVLLAITAIILILLS